MTWPHFFEAAWDRLEAPIIRPTGLLWAFRHQKGAIMALGKRRNFPNGDSLFLGFFFGNDSGSPRGKPDKAWRLDSVCNLASSGNIPVLRVPSWPGCGLRDRPHRALLEPWPKALYSLSSHRLCPLALPNGKSPARRCRQDRDRFVEGDRCNSSTRVGTNAREFSNSRGRRWKSA